MAEGHLAAGHVSLRNQIISRYSGFFRKLLNSPSKEVRILSRIVSKDPRSNTCSNLRYLQKLTGLVQPQFYSSHRIKTALPVKKVPETEQWRLGLLDNLMKMKQERYLSAKDSKAICAMMDSLCSTWAGQLLSFQGDPITPTIWGLLQGAARLVESSKHNFLFILGTVVRINNNNGWFPFLIILNPGVPPLMGSISHFL